MSDRDAHKGWFVVGVLDSDEKDQRPHQISSVYSSREVAAQFADLARKQLKRPETVDIRTRAYRAKLPIT